MIGIKGIIEREQDAKRQIKDTLREIINQQKIIAVATKSIVDLNVKLKSISYATIEL